MLYSKNKLYRWTLTITDQTAQSLTLIEDILKPLCKSFIIGDEIAPTTQLKHYQIYLSMRESTRSPLVLIQKKYPKESFKHWTFQPVYSTVDAQLYAQKECICSIYKGTYKINKSFILPDMNPNQLFMTDVIINQSNSRNIFLFSDPVGCTGKSTLIKHFINKYPTVLFLVGGTPESQIFSVVSQCKKMLDDERCSKIYVFCDITKMSPFLRGEKKVALISALESLTTGLMSCTMYGKYKNIFCEDGKIVCTILTNSHPEIWDGLISEDRQQYYLIHPDKDKTTFYKWN